MFLRKFFEDLGESDPRVEKVWKAVLTLLDAVAAFTPTKIDDWLVGKLRAAGADDRLIDELEVKMKPERIQEPEDLEGTVV